MICAAAHQDIAFWQSASLTWLGAGCRRPSLTAEQPLCRHCGRSTSWSQHQHSQQVTRLDSCHHHLDAASRTHDATRRRIGTGDGIMKHAEAKSNGILWSQGSKCARRRRRNEQVMLCCDFPKASCGPHNVVFSEPACSCTPLQCLQALGQFPGAGAPVHHLQVLSTVLRTEVVPFVHLGIETDIQGAVLAGRTDKKQRRRCMLISSVQICTGCGPQDKKPHRFLGRQRKLFYPLLFCRGRAGGPGRQEAAPWARKQPSGRRHRG